MAGRAAWAAWAAAAALLTGCSAGGTALGAPSAGNTPVTITWWANQLALSGNDPRRVMIDAFERAYPSIRVNLVTIGGDAGQQRDTLASQLASGIGIPDVYLGDVIWPAAFGHAGLALPLSDHLPRTFWSRFAPGLLAGATYHGKTYAAPFYTSQGLLYYRRDLLEQAHLPVPETWEQLAIDAEALLAAGVVKYGYVWEGAPYEGLTCVWTEVMRDAGGESLNREGSASTIDSPQSLVALQFLLGLIRDGVSPAEVATFNELEVTNLFDSGQAAFARQWNSAYISARTSAVAAGVGVAPLPAFAGQPKGHYSTAGGADLYVNPRTPHLDAALTFVRWLTDVPAEEIMATAYSELPANERVRTDPLVASGGPVLAADSRSTLVSRPANTPSYSAVSQAIYTNLGGAIVGAQSPEAALAAAGRQIDAALQRSS